MDDIILTGNNLEEIQNITALLLYWPDLRHRLQRSTSEVVIGPRRFGRVDGPRNWAPKIIMNYHACGVYSTFRSSTSKYPLEALRPMRVRVSRERLHA